MGKETNESAEQVEVDVTVPAAPAAEPTKSDDDSEG